MQAFDYSDRSFAVYGETKPWKENLKALGGKINYNLRSRSGQGTEPGWIFSKKQENAVAQFIAQASAGQVAPMAPQAAQQSYPTYKQLGAAPQVMPAAPWALPNQGLLLPQVSAFSPEMLATRTSGFTQPTPGPISVFPRAPSPRITGMQTVSYAVPLPQMGQQVTLSAGNQTQQYTVSALETTAPVDSILLNRIPTAEDPQPLTTRAVIISGKWQINGLTNEHTLIFAQQPSVPVSVPTFLGLAPSGPSVSASSQGQPVVLAPSEQMPAL